MKSTMYYALAALLGLALAPCLSLAQGEQPEPEAKPAQPQISNPKPSPQPYLIMIAVKESNSGKPILEKNYSLTVIADDPRYNYSENLRDGDHIPYSTGNGHEYHDMHTDIDCNNVYRRGDMVAVGLRVESNSLVANPDGVNLPLETKWSISVIALLLPGKPTVVYSATDALTGHKVEILATAQLLNSK
jgi:hypothetical protein